MVADVTSVSVSIWYDVISSSTDSLYFVINSFASIGGAKATTMAVFSRGINLIIVGGPGTISNFIIVMVIHVHVSISLIWYA